MKVVIRADASLAIGSGHVMRCLVLAEALRAAGAEVGFVCRAHSGHLGSTIAARGFAVDLLSAAPRTTPIGADEPAHALWLGADPLIDASETRAVVRAQGGVDLLIVDHYGLDRRFESVLRPEVGRIAVIDDLADRPHHCDVLIDQNFGAEIPGRYAGLLPEGTEQLLGAATAMIAPAFAAARAARPVRDGSLRRILVFFGGVDADNASLLALEGIEVAGLSDIAVDVVVGGANPHSATLADFAAARPWVTLLPPQPTLAPLMAAADLAIGAGGVTAIERAVVGLPSLLLAIAENQVAPARGLARAGGALYLGRLAEVSAADIAAALRLLARTPEALAHMAETAAGLCDGRGLERLVRRLAPPVITLRRAAPDDAERLWAWRNHPDTRRHSNDASEIPLDGHLAWFAATLARDDRDLLIGSDATGDVGVLRYDFAGDRAVVSVYLDPSRQGGGLGAPLLVAGTRHVAATRPGIARIDAVVLPENHASHRVFAAAGYAPETTTYTIDPRTAGEGASPPREARG